MAGYGDAVNGAVRRARVHEALMRCAKEFSGEQVTIDSTETLLGQLGALLGQLQVETTRLAEATAQLPALGDALDRVELF